MASFYLILLQLTAYLVHGVRYCQIGIGSYGLPSVQEAYYKGYDIVAVFSRSSHVGEDIGTVFGLDKKLGVVVSPMTNLDKVLKETKPDICLDATVPDLDRIYDNLAIVVKNKVNLMTFCESAVYPFNDPKVRPLAEKLHQAAIDNGVTIYSTGFQDVYQQLFFSLAQTMHDISTVRFEFNLNMAGFDYGLEAMCINQTVQEFEQNCNSENSHMCHLFNYFNGQIVQWVARQLNAPFKVDQVATRCSPIIREERFLDIEAGMNLGLNASGSVVTENGVFIQFEANLEKRNNEDKDMVIVQLFSEKRPSTNIDLGIKSMDPMYGTFGSGVNRVQDIIDGPPGFYGAEGLGRASYTLLKDDETDGKQEL